MIAKRLRYLLPLGVLVVVGGFLFVSLGLNPRLISSPLINQPMPAFDLPTLENGDHMVSAADLNGEPALVNVWASWCISCRQEHPVMMGLVQHYGVTIYGLNYKDKRADAMGYLNYAGNPFVWNAHDLDGRLGIDLGVYGTPETFVIDRHGRIRHKHTGPLSWDQAENEILPILEKLHLEES
ncbi:cytochrome c biogenesis protein CcmG/thiol:disulfide interchange protein DsbE [Natronocella acetinitrilica]|uniref:Cytochrome c biogenesis protein CcmG/thiol:disulfide interchange protein DsbE n=1 Tax=Natronocella acetinitrilica TaxID=414046 RepID=A0AAE3G8N9_9GAMM|nr:DsbE family thiol:disulfide interchange protein [Natronocella acetinitrilica]MCP1675852.1 cytochrome c biogenesis protein CcmG/thiol:disulfide interchange protein DsbE [Natronocella acetinitrilica]